MPQQKPSFFPGDKTTANAKCRRGRPLPPDGAKDHSWTTDKNNGQLLSTRKGTRSKDNIHTKGDKEDKGDHAAGVTVPPRLGQGTRPTQRRTSGQPKRKKKEKEQ